MYVLGCYPYDEKDQRAPTVRAFVDAVLCEYGLELDDNKYVMSDNENKMKSAFSGNCKRIGCSSHYLNKQLEHAFTSQTLDKELVDCDEAQTLFKHVKTLVTHVRRSHKQSKLPIKLQIYCETRFSGAFVMLNVFLKVFHDMVTVISPTHLPDYFNIDKELLERICTFLIPFDEVLKQLSDTKRPTLHRVLPLRQYLINMCSINVDDLSGLEQLKSFLGKKVS